MASLPESPPDLPFSFGLVEIVCPDRACHVLTMTPRVPTVFGAKRRESLRGEPTLSPVERRILDFVAARPENTPVLLLRGADEEGNRLWRFDPAFDDDELEETGRLFSRAVMPLYRGLLARGIVLFVHSDWGYREIGPIRRGLDALAEHPDPRQPALSAVDGWISRNMLLYSSLSMEHVVEQLLPTHLVLLDRRTERAQRLLGRVPPGAVY